VADRPDVVVAGAGIIGCAIGYQLAHRGARVRIFEARTVGAGATQASAGVLAPYVEAPHSGPLRDLTVRSLDLFDRFVSDVRQDSGVDVEYRKSGTLEVAADEVEAEALRQSTERLARDPAIGAEWLDPSAARSAEPTLPEGIAGARLIKSHGYVVAAQLTEALAWGALRHGAEIETSRPITAIHERAGRLEVVTHDGATWPTDRVVIAAGSWGAQLRLKAAALRAIRPVRGQLIRLAWFGRPPRHVVWGPNCYLVPWEDGTVLVGATVEDVGFDERATAAGVRDLLEAACELVPAAWSATFREARVGLRPASIDGLPILGQSETLPGVVYATGHYRNGILLAPVTADLIGKLILEDRADPALQPFHPSRFENS
jgi:glycine oxidase